MNRKLLSILVAALLIGDIAAAGRLLVPTRGRAAPRVAGGVTREFTLTAAPMKWQIQPGLVVDGWGYNGQIPGPTIRVTEGDLVKVHLINNLPEPTTIHWHGVNVPVGMDGVPGLTQDAVQPGDTFDYQFVASNPGTHMYHSHTDTDAQIQLGLYTAPSSSILGSLRRSTSTASSPTSSRRSRSTSRPMWRWDRPTSSIATPATAAAATSRRTSTS